MTWRESTRNQAEGVTRRVRGGDESRDYSYLSLTVRLTAAPFQEYVNIFGPAADEVNDLQAVPILQYDFRPAVARRNFTVEFDREAV